MFADVKGNEEIKEISKTEKIYDSIRTGWCVIQKDLQKSFYVLFRWFLPFSEKC